MTGAANANAHIIVDAHVHLFNRLERSTELILPECDQQGRWVQIRRIPKQEMASVSAADEQPAYTADILLANMDQAGADKAVLLQGPFYGNHNPYVLNAVQQHPGRLAAAAYLDPWEEDAKIQFDEMADSYAFSAVKLEMSVSFGLCGLHPNARLDDPEVFWLWPAMSRHNMTLTLDLGVIGSLSYQTSATRSLAEKFPDLRIVVCHLGQPTATIEFNPHLRSLWQDQISLGDLPNVWFDMSSLPAYFRDEGYPYPNAEKYLRIAVDRIGPEKILWGTDSPTNLDLATYPQFMEMAHSHTHFLSPSEQAMILGTNAMKVYQWLTSQ